jgi:hypothetical protein
MEAACSSQTSADFERTTRRYIPEDITVHVWSLAYWHLRSSPQESSTDPDGPQLLPWETVSRNDIRVAHKEVQHEGMNDVDSFHILHRRWANCVQRSWGQHYYLEFERSRVQSSARWPAMFLPWFPSVQQYGPFLQNPSQIITDESSYDSTLTDWASVVKQTKKRPKVWRQTLLPTFLL